jgi:hypothetical protein
MVIEKGEPWLLWPDKVSYGINTGNIGETFEGNNSFTLSMNINILTKEKRKRTVFAKVPNYCGVDIEDNNRLLLILRLERDGETISEYLMSDVEIIYEFQLLTYRFSKENGIIEVLLDEKVIIKYKIKDNEKLLFQADSHIIFGAGNFPSNNFNMNYCSYDIDFLLISKNYLTIEEVKKFWLDKKISEEIVGLYDFKETTEFKVFDLTNNCNFLNKII